MAVTVTYQCDNNGCRNTSTALKGWFGVVVDQRYGASYLILKPLHEHPSKDKRLACSEGCALSMVQRYLESIPKEPVRILDKLTNKE